MIQTLKGRLSLWYFFSVGIIFLAFSVAISVLLWITLQKQIDHHVYIVVKEAQQIVKNYQASEREELIKNLVSAQGMTVVVLSPDGAPILETNSPDIALITEHQLQKIMLSQSLHESEPTHFTESDIRFAAIPTPVRAGKGVVAVGYSTKILYAAFYRLLFILAGSVVFLVLPTTYLGYKLLQKQLHPLEEIALYAQSISSLPLSHRLELSHPTRELLTIQESFNLMLEKLGEFFSAAAHALKTPLTVLRLQIENVQLAESSKNKLLVTIDQVSETIQDLLYLSKIGQVKTKPRLVNISAIMVNLAELAATLGSNKQISVTSKIEPDIIISGDEKTLTRALSNLVQNAVNYTKNHGQVELKLTKQAEKIFIVIRDTGIGISNKDLPNIFRRFYRGRNAVLPGSGLGLPIAKAVIESFGGSIAVHSRLYRGTTVTVTL
ncbi:MAG: Signal transduction histidine kinase [Candidatus Beckwithbacteria bacterium GW2011_GWA2_43_10]|uniref:histidine kinase n=1 Tax=Candidatus Beckwithbacteria bacterium GW2011_GWA2_43_10 TaxID=1618369 RepID=A0A0G1EZ79_9BACT|nr:MAG: Signal transduction histidine kinase [Candidatus Beckwithbacteria bacterium GW2011_GWA2_43_10]